MENLMMNSLTPEQMQQQLQAILLLQALQAAQKAQQDQSQATFPLQAVAQQPADLQENQAPKQILDNLTMKKAPKTEDSNNFEGLPKESEENSRKRPAAIQELFSAKIPKLEESPADFTLNDSQISQSELDNTSTSASSPSSENASVLTNDFLTNLLSSLSDATASNDHLEFTQVPSRLSLLTSATKYKMTVGEVRRRIDGPESFNLSLLGALFRRAKTPNMTDTITKQLAEAGLQIPKGRRRKTELTLFSAMSEAESVKLVSDFEKLADQHFPAKELAAHWNNKDQTELREKLVALKESASQAEKFIELLGQDSSPVDSTVKTPFFESNIQEPLTHLSLLSHGFATPAMAVGVKMFLAFVRQQIEQLESYMR